jgi:phosphoribosylformylglycinamidine cyclo-ligase
VGEAILSPTRTYAPVIHKLLESNRSAIKGLIHCSGGGQTKCKRFGQKVHYIKDNLLSAPPIFTEIQKHSGTSWEEMYQVYNMGHRMEVYCEPSDTDKLLETIHSFGLEAQVIGQTETVSGANQVTIRSEYGEFNYA